MRDSQPSSVSSETRQIERISLSAFLINLGLAGLKIILALSSGSLAIMAGAIDSATDSVASLAVYGGVRLSSKKTASFPLGLYKIENLISMGIAFFIFFAGYEIVRQTFVDQQRGKGLRVAEWLVENKVDQILVTEDIKHKGPGYMFANAGVAVNTTEEEQLERALDVFLHKQQPRKSYDRHDTPYSGDG